MEEKASGYIIATIPIETRIMIKEMQMLDLHDDNGPGKIKCPICGESTNMRWHWGKRRDNPDEIKHKSFCPIHIFK